MSATTKKSQPARSLTATLTIAFLILSVVALVISSGLQMLSNFQAQQTIIASQQQLIAQEASKTVSGFFQEKFALLEIVGRVAKPDSSASTEQKQILGSLLKRQIAFRQLMLLNAQDQPVAQVSRRAEAVSGQLTEQFGSELSAQTKQGKNYISPVYIDSNTSEPLVVMASPATDALGDFQGTLVAEVNLKFMWDLIDQLKVGETGTVFVVDRQGNLIAFSDIARVLQGENVQSLDKVSEFVNTQITSDVSPTSVSTGILGKSVATTYVALGAPDWAVVTEMPMEEAYREVIRGAVTAAGITLVMAVLAGLLGGFVARRLTVPLVSLTNTATRIAEGEIELQVAPHGPREVGALAHAFNNMTLQLRNLIIDLEQRVAERTTELTQRGQELEKRNLQLATTMQQAQRRSTLLSASARVARTISQVRNLDDLLPEVTRVISQTFGYYHVGIFATDELDRFAVLRAANSEGGQRMLARGHKLSIGQEGIVGYVTSTGEPRIALDVGTDAIHFDNPDLPETRSELALPLRVGKRTFGALDVQSTQEAAFTEEDISVLSTLADQIVIAIENARLFAQAQTALQTAEETAQRYLRQQWQRLVSTRQAISHEYHISGVPTVDAASLPEIEQAARRGEVVIAKGIDDSPAATALAVPIKLRDQVVGVIDLHETDRKRQWSDDEIAILTAVADQAALALENARLIEETESLAQRERTINEINSRVRQTIDLDTILKTAVTELGQSLKAARVMARLNTSATNPAAVGTGSSTGNRRGSDHV